MSWRSLAKCNQRTLGGGAVPGVMSSAARSGSKMARSVTRDGVDLRVELALLHVDLLALAGLVFRLERELDGARRSARDLRDGGDEDPDDVVRSWFTR